MNCVYWKQGCKVIYITLLTDQAKKQGRLASRASQATRTACPRPATHCRLKPTARAPSIWAVGLARSSLLCAIACSCVLAPNGLALLALARELAGLLGLARLRAWLDGPATPMPFVFAINIFPILFIVSYTTNHRRTIRFIRVAQLTNIRDTTYDFDKGRIV